MKICTRCKIPKDESEFNKQTKQPDGLDYYCRKCRKEYHKIYISTDKGKEIKKKYAKKYYLENKKIIIQKQKIYNKKNREKYIEIKRNRERKRYNKIMNNPILKKIYIRKRRKNNDLKFRLNHNISRAIRHSLKGRKERKHWEFLVGYTLDDLKKHLEKQFMEGMTWNNYGKWQIDHKIPKSVFNFIKPEDIDFKKCWALSNLQPMWTKENQIKGDKLIKPFQPAFSF